MTLNKNENYEKVFVIIMTVLFLLFFCGFVLNRGGNQAKVFFNGTGDYMADYYNVAKYSANRDVYLYGEEDPLAAEHAYLPLTYVIMYFMSRCADYANLDAFSAGKGTTMGLATSAFFMFMTSAVLYIILYDAYNGKKLFKFLVATMMMLSGIFIFSFERGNIIVLTVASLFFFIMNYNNENKVIKELSFVALAVAAALKGYPALFGILLLFEKRYKEAGRLITYGLIFAFVPFLFFEGGFSNIPTWIENLSANSERYTYLQYPRFNFRFWANMIEDTIVREKIHSVFSVLDYLLCGIAVLTTCFHKKNYKMILQLLLCIVILPVNSAEYSGLYLFLAIILFFNEEEKTKSDWIYLFLFICVLNPFQIMHNEVNFTTLLMNVAASVMLVLSTSESLVCAIKKIRRVRLAKRVAEIS